MVNLYKLAKPAIFQIDPERAHRLTIKALQTGLSFPNTAPKDPRLEQNLWGLKIKNPLGLAAGFDKNAQVPNELIKLGFGFVEVGTLTPKPQTGNPKPRLFRLPSDHGIINRMGFNNEGQDAALLRLQDRKMQGVIGVNIGANKDSQNRIQDYVEGFKTFQGVADYFTINISSPNTPGLRDLQNPDSLDELLKTIMHTRTKIVDHGGRCRPIFVKIAPDIEDQNLEAVLYKLLDHKVDAVIISNTTLSRTGLKDKGNAHEAGGLSGRPLFTRSTRMLARAHIITEGALPIIGAGGIECTNTAWMKLEAGANLIQLYSCLIYQGPSLVSKILKGLSEKLDKEDIHSLASIRGRTAEKWANLKL